MGTSDTHVCPLCATDFHGALCHPTCPMARGCAMVKCPSCGYEFPQESKFINMLTKLFRPARQRIEEVVTVDPPRSR